MGVFYSLFYSNYLTEIFGFKRECGYMRKIDLKNVAWKEGRYYISWNLNTDISSFGDTKKEAIESLREALELYFEDVSPSKIAKVERLDIVPLAF